MLPLSLDRCSSTVVSASMAGRKKSASMACALQTGLLGLFGHPLRVCRSGSWGLGKFRVPMLEGFEGLFHPGRIPLPNSRLFPRQIEHADGFALRPALDL